MTGRVWQPGASGAPDKGRDMPVVSVLLPSGILDP
jgi:hypothetical protein